MSRMHDARSKFKRVDLHFVNHALLFAQLQHILQIMPIYVDDARIPWRGKQWCHMVADTVDELHEFASRLGLRPEWFQRKTLYPHYDVTMSVRERALKFGAVAAHKEVVVTRAKGLRVQLNQQARQDRLAERSREEKLCIHQELSRP